MLLIAPVGSSRLQIRFDGAPMCLLLTPHRFFFFLSLLYVFDCSLMFLIAPYGSSRLQILFDGGLDLAFDLS